MYVQCAIGQAEQLHWNSLADFLRKNLKDIVVSISIKHMTSCHYPSTCNILIFFDGQIKTKQTIIVASYNLLRKVMLHVTCTDALVPLAAEFINILRK